MAKTPDILERLQDQLSGLSTREQAKTLQRLRDTIIREEAHQRAEASRRVAEGKQRRRTNRVARVATGESSYEAVAGQLTPEHAHPDAVAAARRRLEELNENVRTGKGYTLAAVEQEDRSFEVVAGRRRDKTQRLGAFWAQLGPSPKCAPGDIEAARLFHRQIVSCIERGGWTMNERQALRNLEVKWGTRARGEDPRFMVVGTQVGRLPRQVERRINLLKGKQHG